MSFTHPCVCPLSCPQDGNTALFYAANKNSVDVAELLLSRGADIEHENKVTGTRGRRGAGMGASNSQVRMKAIMRVGVGVSMRVSG